MGAIPRRVGLTPQCCRDVLGAVAGSLSRLHGTWRVPQRRHFGAFWGQPHLGKGVAHEERLLQKLQSRHKLSCLQCKRRV